MQSGDQDKLFKVLKLENKILTQRTKLADSTELEKRNQIRLQKVQTTREDKKA